MLILALDTTTRAGSMALLQDGECLAEASGDTAITHGQRLPSDLIRLLDVAGRPLSAVDRLAVAAGPGSFTGLRVGIAAVQGLAFATGRLVVPVSTLEALARAGEDHAGLVVPWMDAQRGEVFAALYDRCGTRILAEAINASPETVLAGLVAATRAEPLHFIGDGAVRYAALIAAGLGSRATIALHTPALAPWIGRIALDAPARAVAPHAVAPIYVRRPDAEIARDRRAGG